MLSDRQHIRLAIRLATRAVRLAIRLATYSVPLAISLATYSVLINALFRTLCHTQGLSQIQTASDEYKWGVKLSELTRIWRGGCIIRAKILNDISDALKTNPDLESLLLDEGLASELAEASDGLRAIVAKAVANGLSAPGFSGALAYFDGMRRGRCSANMIQAQRDFFGAHTFKRLDKEGAYHAAW